MLHADFISKDKRKFSAHISLILDVVLTKKVQQRYFLNQNRERNDCERITMILVHIQNNRLSSEVSTATRISLIIINDVRQ